MRRAKLAHYPFMAFLLAPVAALGGGFDRAIDAVVPRVVKLYGLSVGSQPGYGTGVLASPDGLVLTVLSLLIDARRVRAVTSDGTFYEAEVVRRDPSRQLALLRLKPPDHGGEAAASRDPVGPLPYFDLKCGADATREESLRPGDWVIAAGNPFKVAEGAEPASIAHGVFSARTELDARRQVKEFPYRGDVLVIDAVTSNPGAPGSAVVDVEGRFVGMIGREVVSNLTHTHFNYAVPRDVLCEFFNEATDAMPRAASAAIASPSEGTVDPGIRLTRTGYRNIPPLVDRVRRGSPAEAADVRKDDLILSLNGKNVANAEEYDEQLRFVPRDRPLDLVVRRGRSIVAIHIEPEKQ